MQGTFFKNLFRAQRKSIKLQAKAKREIMQ